jgi:hypothetical protein
VPAIVCALVSMNSLSQEQLLLPRNQESHPRSASSRRPYVDAYCVYAVCNGNGINNLRCKLAERLGVKPRRSLKNTHSSNKRVDGLPSSGPFELRLIPMLRGACQGGIRSEVVVPYQVICNLDRYPFRSERSQISMPRHLQSRPGTCGPVHPAGRRERPSLEACPTLRAGGPAWPTTRSMGSAECRSWTGALKRL